MKANLNKVKDVVNDLPFMSLERAEMLAEFFVDNNIVKILELGFNYGVSTCYMASSLEQVNESSIVTIDLESAKTRKPNIEQLLKKIGQFDKVNIYYEPTSYTWRLMKLLEEDSNPRFDFCYIDGAHSWFIDGFAFFLVDRLLKPNGWILLDDLNWSYEKSPSLREKDWVKAMPKEEREALQVKKIWDILVKTHPQYGNFKVMYDEWGLAQKIK